jgi:hypothetical protein
MCGRAGDPEGSPERAMYEAGRVKLKLQWRPEEVRDSRILDEGKLQAMSRASPTERQSGLKMAKFQG